jgi:hypothetical protein
LRWVEIGKTAGGTPVPRCFARRAHFIVKLPNSKFLQRNLDQEGISAIFEVSSLLPAWEAFESGAGIDVSTLPTAKKI